MLVDEALHDDVELLVERPVVLHRVGHDEELPLKVSKSSRVGRRHRARKPLPEVVDAVLDHGAVEELKDSQREV